MTYRIPNKGKFSQPNKGEIFGNLYRTQGIDLKTNPGKMRVSPRLIINTKDDDAGITGMGIPVSFVVHEKSSTQQYYAVCGIGDDLGTSGTGRVFVTASDSASVAFVNDTTTNSPTNVHAAYSDAVHWADGNNTGAEIGRALFVSTYSGSTSQIKKLFATWNTTWFTSTLSGSFAANGGPKNMCPAFNGNLYITDDDRVIYVPFSTSGSVVPAVTSGTGTLNFYGQYRVIWIRSTSTQLFIGLMTYDSGSGSRGYVGVWDTTGTACQKIIDINAPCAPSATVLDDVCHIVDAYGRLKRYNGTGFPEIARLPVANQNIEMPGIYNDLTNIRWIHHRGMSVVDGKININVNNIVSTGVYVEDMPSGVWEYDEDIGLYHKSAPCVSTTDWGQQLIQRAGAILGTKRTTASFLAGFGYYTDSGATSHYGIFHDDLATTTNRRAIFITPWLDAGQIVDTFQRVFYRFRQLLSGSKILGKYRVDKSATLPFVASATWISTTRFSSADTNFQFASVGDEVEIVQGKSASTTAHITALVIGGGGLWIVDLDDTIGSATGSCKVKVNNFRTLGTAISQLLTSTGWFAINKSDNSIQVKTEIRDEGGFEMGDVTITSKVQQKTE